MYNIAQHIICTVDKYGDTGWMIDPAAPFRIVDADDEDIVRWRDERDEAIEDIENDVAATAENICGAEPFPCDGWACHMHGSDHARIVNR